MTTGIDNALPPGSVSMTRHEDTTDEDVFTPRPTTSSDPNEPLNWSNWRKILNFGLTLGVATAAFTHYSLQPVFWQQMTGDPGVTINQLNNAASGMLSGVALGCILFIPLTSKYGRRPTYLLSTAVMASVTWWISKMTTNVELLLTSIFLGFSGAINETAVEMTRGSANGVYFLAVMLGTFLTPVAGGAQADSQG
ncbi:hypothetical protein AK830_g1362 [Neonectria ditissima]|uniref:Major facilitator superfamily (MFS) profile domain-containing protein n=1 Tax=Neonectria ditissima TaxID=78410 RepID=A0A0P7BUZ8_9HYPO|nr:hypothetical protein AK830_g1362 [Neonectria ditissima]